jgi:DNA anti-recombination protein RmuC
LNYALEKKVIPVSPNLLYAYLMTIVMGLRGLQIEKQAVQIRKDIGMLGNNIKGFNKTFSTMGGHLRNASSQYELGQNQLNKFNVQLDQIHSASGEETD